MLPNTPRYRIQAVAERTGVPAATLRAWERRYGFPTPVRSQSSYRLYRDEDVALVVRMRNLVAQGVAPHEAARTLIAAVSTPAVQATRPVAASGEGVTGENGYSRLIDLLLAACIRLDVAGFETVLKGALLAAPFPEIARQVFAPLLARIGELWAESKISIAEEHFASQLITERTLEALRGRRLDGARRSVLLSCVDREQHVLPLYLTAMQFADFGFSPLLLGAQLPPDDLKGAIKTLRPNLVGLSITTVPQPSTEARALIQAYARACAGTPWVVGGKGVAEVAAWVERAGGYACLGQVDENRDAINALLAKARNGSRPRKLAKLR